MQKTHLQGCVFLRIDKYAVSGYNKSVVTSTVKRKDFFAIVILD